MTESNPLVSVIMPVYNSEQYLKSAIQSILTQTYKNFELICIYDISADGSIEILKKFNKIDKRIKIIKNQGKKISGALNTGLQAAKGEYIARMDSDDISLPNRFSLQVNFLNKNKNYALCCTNAIMIDEKSKIIFKKMYLELKNIPLEIIQIFENGVAHPTVMFRSDCIKDKNIKYQNIVAEDYQFWFDILEYYRIKRIPQPLLLYRSHKNSLSNKSKRELISSARVCQLNFVKNALNNYVSKKSSDCLYKIINGELIINFKKNNLTKKNIQNLVEEMSCHWKFNPSDKKHIIKYIFTINIINSIKRKKFKVLIYSVFELSFSINLFFKKLIFHLSYKNKIINRCRSDSSIKSH